MAGRKNRLRRQSSGRSSRFYDNPEETTVSSHHTPRKRHLKLRHSIEQLKNEMPASIGTQVFTNCVAVSGALAGFILGFKLTGARNMSVFEVVATSTAMAVGSFVGVLVIKSFH